MKKHQWILFSLLLFLVLGACQLFSIKAGTTNINEGLVAWYPFDGNLNDSSGLEQHASAPYGPVSFGSDRSGQPGKAIELDGKKDVLTAPISRAAETLGSLSVSVYFKTNSSSIQNLICRRKKYECFQPQDFGGLSWTVNASSQREPHFAVVSPEDISCETPRGIDAFTDVVYGMYKIETKEWYHLVCVFEGGLQRIYINGSLRQSLSRSFNTLRECNDNIYVIGGFVNELPTRFNGMIDDLRIYNRALGEEEILRLAKDFKPIN
jgi:hypothetical protein